MLVIPDYWLCPVCSKMFSLIHVETGKVVLRLLEQESEVATAPDQLTTTYFLPFTSPLPLHPDN
jgi:hypothetical protein